MNNLSLTIVSDLKNDLRGALTLIYSFWKNGNSKRKLINIITNMERNDVKFKFLQKFAHSLGYEIKYINIDKEKEFIDILRRKENTDNYISLAHISPIAYAKILVFKLIKEKTIYMDTDSLLISKLNVNKFLSRNKKILFVKNGEHLPDYWFERYEGIYEDKNEVIKHAFNSGIFVKNFNDEIYGEEQYNKLKNSLKDNEFTYLDQAHFNYVYKKHKSYLPLEFNYPVHNKDNKIVQKTKKPIVLHFASKNKPWLRVLENKFMRIWEMYWVEVQNRINLLGHNFIEFSDMSNFLEIKKGKLENNKSNHKLKIRDKLTLIITIHSQFESIPFFLELLENCSNEIIFAFDNPKVSEKWIQQIESKGFKYYINKQNTGKLNLIFNVSEFVYTEYFKIIDQDDSISIKHLKRINSKINEISGPLIIKHKAFKVKESNALFKQSLDRKTIKEQVVNSDDVFYNQQTNCDTIYHTKTIREFKKGKHNLTRQDFHNDVLISNYLVGLGLDLKIISDGFYIQFHEMGQTSKINVKRAECILELYENYKYLQSNLVNFDIKRLMNGEKKNHIRFIKRFTIDYLKGIDEIKGDELNNKTNAILEELWKA